MATHSRIAIARDDGSIESIACYFDGYKSGVGERLFNHYCNEVIIDDLMKIGNLDTLGNTPESSVLMVDRYNFCPDGKIDHKSIINRFNNDHDFLRWANTNHVYLWRDGKWWWDSFPLSYMFDELTFTPERKIIDVDSFENWC